MAQDDTGKKTQGNTAPITIHFKPEVKKILQKIANDEHRFLSNQVNHMLEKELKKLGLLKPN